jgi:flagellar assembly protein FliH
MMSSSTSAVRKFAFDTVFDAGGAIVRDGDGFRTQFNTEEVAEIRANAFEEGRQTKDREIAAALTALSQTMGVFVTQMDQEARRLREEATALALAAARKAADVALTAYGEDRVLAALSAALESLRAGPRLVVRLAPDLVAGLKSRLEDSARMHGFDGALIVRADPAVAIGDVGLEWSEGAIIHDREEAFARIQDIVTGALENAGEETDVEMI